MNAWGPNDDLKALEKLFAEMDMIILETPMRPSPGYENYVNATEMVETLGFQKIVELYLTMKHVADFKGDWNQYAGKTRQYMVFKK